MKLIECVPNFSEGSDSAVIERIRERIAAVEGVSILHVTSDASHNRSVITFVAPFENMADAAFAAIRAARDNIDIRLHEGVHPRIGAADVVPFIPLDGATMDDCVALARLVGERVGRELEIPVFLYEHATSRASRRNLADVRRGGLARVAAELASQPESAADFGPAHIHPTAGAVAIGARPFLIAFNVYIGSAEHIGAARDIARDLRESSGGTPAIKALGLEVGDEAQVSMNLVDIETTSLAAAFEVAERATRARGLEITWSEIIGLVPESAVLDVAGKKLKLRDDLRDHVLERRLLAARSHGTSIEDYVASVGSGDPFPGGGSVAAITASLAAALAQMVASLTLGRPRYAAAEDEMRSVASSAQSYARQLTKLARADAEAYARVTDARRLPATSEADRADRSRALESALTDAMRIPLEVARLASEVAKLSSAIALRGNQNAISDAGVAALLAVAACEGAGYNVRSNAVSLADVASARNMVDDANRYLDTARASATVTASAVEQALQATLARE